MRFNNIILHCFNTLQPLTYLGVISIFLFNVLDDRLKQTSKPVTYKRNFKIKKKHLNDFYMHDAGRIVQA